VPDKSYEITFDGQAADDSLYADVLQIEVDERVAAASTFRVRFALTQQDSGEWTYTDDDRFSLFTNVGISVGFSGGAGGLEPVIDGYITGVTVHVGARPEESYLEVQGMDASVLLSLEEKTIPWPNLADSDIVQQIVSGYGFTVQAESTSPVHQDIDTLIVQRGTDIQFVRSLARRNGYEFYFQKDPTSGDVTAYFQPPQLSGSPQPDIAVQFGEQSNLLSFDVAVSGLRPLDVFVSQVDPSSKSVNTGQASSTQLTTLGASTLESLVSAKLGQLVTPDQAQGRMLLVAQPTADATELSAVAQAVRDEAGWLITATGEINSDAYGAVLHPGRLVLVKGVGSEYSGTYYVTQVTHRLRSDGSYTQGFELRRNARDLDGSEQFGSGPGGGLGVSLG
jgi:phage protein D